jgi:cell fate (sporulation/competence/biofilm development) regulator YlbF (YheA/YmcA/DUF963 family)
MASSSSPPKSPPASATFGSFEQTQKAIQAMQNKGNKPPVPEIDFSLHAMEDGTQVSTMERVCKGAIHSMLWLIS